MSAPQRLIPPSTLAQLANLELVARTVVEGALTGLHRSPRFGFSQEFAEYRAYVPGDDLRFIDWNVFARTDRMYVKRFFGDTNTRIVVLVDASASMGIAPAQGAIRKIDFARYLAAAVVYLAARQHDAVGFAAFADDVRVYRPPSARGRAADGIYHLLEGLEPAGATDWPRVLDHVSRQVTKRSLVVMISDFFCEPEPLATRLRGLGARGHDLLLLHLLDPNEERVPVAGSATLRDVETGRVMTVAGDEVARAYPLRLAEHLRALEEATRSAGGHYRLMNTDRPLDRALVEYLRFRERHP